MSNSGVNIIEDEDTVLPFNEEQIEFLKNMLAGLQLSVDISTWCSSSPRVSVSLDHRTEEFGYSHIGSASDSFSFPEHRCERDY